MNILEAIKKNDAGVRHNDFDGLESLERWGLRGHDQVHEIRRGRKYSEQVRRSLAYYKKYSRAFPNLLLPVQVDRFIQRNKKFQLRPAHEFVGALDLEPLGEKLKWVDENIPDAREFMKPFVLAPGKMFRKRRLDLDPLYVMSIFPEGGELFYSREAHDLVYQMRHYLFWPLHLWGTDLPARKFEWKPDVDALRQIKKPHSYLSNPEKMFPWLFPSSLID